MANPKRRKGRGRLSSIDLLPPEAEPHVAWALGELRARDRTQVDILEEFNARLAQAGVTEPISLSAFNRHALRLAATARRLEETRAIAGALTERLDPGDTDDLTVMVGEAIKTLVFELLETTEDGRATATDAMEMARALQAAASAQSVSSERRRKIEAAFAAKAKAAIGKAGKTAGLSAEAIATIERDVLGMAS